MIEQIKNVNLFAGLNEQECAIISNCATARNYAKNAIIINEGDTTRSLYIILSGSVVVTCSNEDGRDFILGTQVPGDYFGELSLLDDEPRSATVTTQEPSRLLVITEPCFKKCLLENPALAVEVCKGLARRVRHLTSIARDIATLDVYGRLVKLLTTMAVEKEGQKIIDQRVTHHELANRVGSSREMVTRILRDLTKGGYIDIEDRHIIIKKNLPPHW